MTDITTHKASRRRLLIALCITSVFMVIQFIAAHFANSMAVLADAGHLFVHNSSLVVALIASSVAIKLASNYHQGSYRAELVGGLVNGILYLLIALTIIISGGDKLLDHHQGDDHDVDSFIMTVVSGVGFLFHTASALILYKGRKDSINVYAVFLHSFFDLLSTVVTFIVGIVIYLTHWHYVDLISSIVISLFVLYTGVKVIIKCTKGLLQDSAQLPDITIIEKALAKIEHISEVHNVTVVNEGNKLIAGAHLVLKASCTKEKHDELCRLAAERCLESQFFIKHSVLQIEAHHCEHSR